MCMNLLQSYFPEWYREIESLGYPLTDIPHRTDFERIRITVERDDRDGGQ